MDEQLQNKVLLGRQMLELHRVQHDEMYEDNVVDKAVEHQRLAEELENNIKLAGFSGTREFFAYNNAYQAYLDGDIDGCNEILAEIADL